MKRHAQDVLRRADPSGIAVYHSIRYLVCMPGQAPQEMAFTEPLHPSDVIRLDGRAWTVAALEDAARLPCVRLERGYLTAHSAVGEPSRR